MRIPCPYCGERDSGEFTCRGEVAPPRPSDDADLPAYLYLRDNPAGSIAELWYHMQGCRQWIVVTRDTRTHLIERAVFARDVGR